MIRDAIRSIIRKMYTRTHPELRVLTALEYRQLKLAEARLRVACKMLDRSFTCRVLDAMRGEAYTSLHTQDSMRAAHEFVDTCREAGHAR